MRRILIGVSSVLVLLAVAAPSALATRAEEQQGAALLRDFQAGKQSCASLSSTQFELIGEYVMSRMIGSPAAHDAMNSRIKQMMGAEREAQAHVFLAQRETDCAHGAAPTGFGQMMGMVAASGPARRNASGLGAGMMGGNGRDGGGWSTGTIVLAVLLGAALLAALAAGLVMVARRREAPGTASEILDRRLADGDIDTEEYERRRRALTDAGGGAGPAGT